MGNIGEVRSAKRSGGAMRGSGWPAGVWRASWGDREMEIGDLLFPRVVTQVLGPFAPAQKHTARSSLIDGLWFVHTSMMMDMLGPSTHEGLFFLLSSISHYFFFYFLFVSYSSF